MGKINASDKIMSKTQKKKKFLQKSPSKRLLWNGIHSFLRRADARGSTDIYRI